MGKSGPRLLNKVLGVPDLLDIPDFLLDIQDFLLDIQDFLLDVPDFYLTFLTQTQNSPMYDDKNILPVYFSDQRMKYVND